MRERYLLHADRSGYTYREILELRPGSARLVTPSEHARRSNRIVAFVVGFAYLWLVGPLLLYPLFFLGRSSWTAPGLVVMALAGGFAAGYLGGLVAVELWWDKHSLLLLAESPRYATPVTIDGIRSFGTFQELRARAPEGDMVLAVPGRPEKVLEALRFAGLTLPS